MKLAGILTLAASASLVLSACVSIAVDDAYAIKALDARDKSRALEAKGSALFAARVEAGGDLAALDEIRQLFVVALRFDPENKDASSWLLSIEDFRKLRLQENLRSLAELSAARGRSEGDDLALLLAHGAVGILDPTNAEFVRLGKEAAALRKTLVSRLLDRSKAAQARMEAGATLDESGEACIEFEAAARALLYLDPGDVGTKKRSEDSKAALRDLVSRRQERARSAIAAGRFDEATGELAALSVIDARIAGFAGSLIPPLTQELDLALARDLYAKGDFVGAKVRVEQAIALKPSEEALALRAQVDQKLAKVAGSAKAVADAVAIDASLAEIDRLLITRDLGSASKKLEALAKGQKDPGRISAVNDRRARLRAALPVLYDKAMAAFKLKDFRTAIPLFEMVVELDPAYQQAADYLSKAREGQKSSEQSSSG